MTDEDGLQEFSNAFRWDRILLDEEEATLVPLECIAGTLENSTQLSQIIPAVNRQFPLSRYKLDHLKRIKKTDQDKILVILFPHASAELQQIFTETRIVNVPQYPAFTREQFDKYNTLWPITFHAGQKVPRDLSTLESKSALQFFYTNLFLEFDRSIHSDRNFAIVVDKDYKIQAKSEEESQEPLGHACMKAIDLVAKAERIRRGVFSTDNAVINSTDNANGVTTSTTKSNGYLCTGSTLFVWREPCIMCSMALVHSRIEQVFFYHANPSAGGLATKVKMGYLKPLNHHFIAFQLKKLL